MSYYDLKISRIPFGWRLYKPIEDEESTPVDMKPLSLDEWQRLDREYCGGSGDLCFLEIEDNGKNGDGIRFRVCVGDDKYVIIESAIPEESLGTLIESLSAVKRLREAEKYGDD